MTAPINHVRYFHLSARMNDQSAQLLLAAHYRALLRALRDSIQQSPLDVLAYCLVPDAWHLVVAQRTPGHAARAFRRVALTQRPLRRTGTMGRCTRRVRLCRVPDGPELVERCAAVERMAVAAGLSRRAEDWPWGSAADRHRFLGGLPLVESAFLGSRRWMDYLNASRRGDGRALRRRHNLPKPPGGFAALAETLDHGIHIARGADDHQPDPHVEGPEHLVVRHAARALQPSEERGHLPALAIE